MKRKDPRDFGYYMPGEWAEHEACWMAWPARVDLWPNVEATKIAYADVANTIAEFESVKLIVKPSMIDDAKKFVSEKVHMPVIVQNVNSVDLERISASETSPWKRLRRF